MFGRIPKNKTSRAFCINFLTLVGSKCLDCRAEAPPSVPLLHFVLFVLQFSSGKMMTLSLMHYAGFMHCHGSADLFICWGV